MKVEWMNHTGFVVSDMERSLAFYKEVLGLEEERSSVMEGDMVNQLTGIEGARVHVVYLGCGDVRHAVELVHFLEPGVLPWEIPPRNRVGTAHLAFIVDDLDALYEELSGRGIEFVNPPALRPEAVYPWAQKVCYMYDPDGNMLELIERETMPSGASVV